MAHVSTHRNCQPCTACCEGHLDLGHDLTSAGGHERCSHCEKTGCGIYAERPQVPCRSFECMWITANSPLPAWMRPDTSRVIVTINRFKWNDQAVVVALKLDDEVPDRTLRYLQEWARLLKLPLTLIDSPVNRTETPHE